MSVRRVKAGTTDVSVIVRIVDSTDGTPETGVVFNTSGIDLWYRRDGAASVDITEATLSALTDAHSDGGFLHVNDGWYRLDLPDAACASGVAGVQIGGTVTGMVVLAPYIELPVNTAEDVYTRLGAPAGASTAADIAAVKVDTAATLADTNELQTDWANGGRLDLILDARASQTTADAIETDTQDIQARLPAALVGGRIDATVDGTGMEAGAVTAIQSGLATAAALTTVDTVVDAIKAVTDLLPDAGALTTLTSGIITGAAATGTLSTTQATTNLTGYADDQLIGRIIIWTSGDCDGEATDITDYASASGLLTFTALTTAPANGDTFKVV